MLALLTRRRAHDIVHHIQIIDHGKTTSFPTISGARLPRMTADGTKFSIVTDNEILVFDATNTIAKTIKIKRQIIDTQWSPDGKKLLILAVQRSQERSSIRYDWSPPAMPHRTLQLVDIDEPDKSISLPTSNLLISHPLAPGMVWHPDGKSIFFAATTENHIGAWGQSQVYRLDLADQRLTKAAPPGSYNPVMSADGKLLAYVALKGKFSSHKIADIKISALDGDDTNCKIESWDAAPSLLGFTKDNKTIVYAEARGVTSTIGTASCENPSPTEVSMDGRLISSLDLIPRPRTYVLMPKSEMVAAVLETATDAPEIFMMKLDNVGKLKDGNWLKISDINAGIPSSTFRTESVTWRNESGFRIEGLLSIPNTARPTDGYPLLTVLHGGPPNVSQNIFLRAPFIYPLEAYLESGIAVFRPNYSGSLGYGPNFRSGLSGNIGRHDVNSILSGIETLIDRKVVNPGKLGIAGWSYGGFLSSALIRKSPIFKAASIGAGPANLSSYIPTSDFPELFIHYFDGSRPFEAAQKIAKASPIFHPVTRPIPVLIQHGKNDLRVPFSQAVENWYGLRASGANVTLSVFPEEGHSLRGAESFRIGACENYVFFIHHLLDDDAPSLHSCYE